MSGGLVCRCPENGGGRRSRRLWREAHWRVMQYKCNHSAFNGYHRTSSNWSSVTCLVCRATWRTRGDYVEGLAYWEEGDVGAPAKPAIGKQS